MVIAQRIFVRAGAVWMWGGDPCGRPGGALAQRIFVRAGEEWMWGGDPCGRPGGGRGSYNA